SSTRRPLTLHARPDPGCRPNRRQCYMVTLGTRAARREGDANRSCQRLCKDWNQRMRRLLPILLLLSAAPAQSTTLRQQYDSCVANAYLDLLVEGRPNTTLTAEAAVQACETE